MSQGTFDFDAPRRPPMPPHVRGSDTSRAAAASVRDAAPSMEAKVLEYVASRGAAGATCDEVEAALGFRHQTAAARIRELVKAGRLAASTIKRPTRSGRAAIAWITTEMREVQDRARQAS